ncbi:olfactory receptor 6N1-like [Dunckerocampus dactyliophorus]|uniref:olfactory receptor 6N1-like n=1 Tax=Dunckerocampus dactyliophorus TaxID=161453 RepID=UPI002406F34C|nr:olfactory receptor 6N1-like [Dunckerocampus dactyliophorus]
MLNQSRVDVLVLTAFHELHVLRFFYVCVTCAAYVLIVVFNASLVLVICMRSALHQPVYIFLANLMCNTLIGCTAFYPKLLHDLLSDVQLISPAGCLVQAFFVHVYVSVECTILTVMAYDRYAAIVHPLSYHDLLRPSAVYKLLAVSWTLPIVANVCVLSASGTLPLCGNRVGRTFCSNRSITHLSCVDISLISLIELLLAAAVVFLPLVMIFCFYVRILIISFQLSKNSRTNKALSTCIPHLVTYVSFVTSIVFEVVQPALAAKNLPHVFRVIMSMEGFLVPPLLNPLIYGLKLPLIRQHVRQLFHPRQGPRPRCLIRMLGI